MSGLTTATVNVAVSSVTAISGFASIHTADPGTTGTSEATGGSPAYARKALTWTGNTTAEVTFDLPPGTYSYFGLFSASTAGTYRGGSTLKIGGVDTPVTLPGQGQIKLTIVLNGTTS